MVFGGAAVWAAIRFGVARGIFSNEAGLGSAPIAHAAANTKGPVIQGLVTMLGTFIDTLPFFLLPLFPVYLFRSAGSIDWPIRSLFLFVGR